MRVFYSILRGNHVKWKSNPCIGQKKSFSPSLPALCNCHPLVATEKHFPGNFFALKAPPNQAPCSFLSNLVLPFALGHSLFLCHECMFTRLLIFSKPRGHKLGRATSRGRSWTPGQQLPFPGKAQRAKGKERLALHSIRLCIEEATALSG